MRLLRKQQLLLGIIKACRVLFQRQDLLRKVLSQRVSEDSSQQSECFVSSPLSSGADDRCNNGMEDVEDNCSSYSSSIESSCGPSLLIQMLMAKATQPSPVKAVFYREELEVC